MRAASSRPAFATSTTARASTSARSAGPPGHVTWTCGARRQRIRHQCIARSYVPHRGWIAPEYVDRGHPL
eukprot:12329145-Alexandrium_andersonii.AAC.1